MRKKKKKEIHVIQLSFMDSFIHGSGKMNRSMDVVKTGTGVYKNKKAYDRKRDKKQQEQRFDQN